MKKQYHINPEKYSLDKLKKALQNRELIPSRIPLKENLEERFTILAEKGIKNLKILIDTLKTKPKIEDFSKQSGIPAEYLILLNREAKSYMPNPIALDKFSGLNPEDLQALADNGIKNTKHIFNKITGQPGKDKLLTLTGIPKERLDEIIALADLARLYGVGPVFARMIYDVGVTSIEAFVNITAEGFIKIYEKESGKKADFSVSDISFSLEIAKELLDS